MPRGASEIAAPVAARGGTSTDGAGGGSQPSMIRSASSTAQSVSTERTTMLLKGFRSTGPSPASRAASWIRLGKRSKLRA